MGAPEARAYHAFVWTGEEMAVWGGCPPRSDSISPMGGSNPITDSWRPISTANGPPCRIRARAVWTGKEIIFSGGDWGCSGCASSTWAAGAVYDPATDLWRPMSGLHAPPAAYRHTVVWTGHEMIQWGGQGACDRAHHCTGIVGPGARYDPSQDTWSPLPALPSTEDRVGHTAVWTGREMIVFGSSPTSSFQEPGWIYDTVTDAWRPLAVPDPAVLNVRRLNHASVWTGSKMLAWGGNSNPASPDYRLGLIFDPVAGVWNRMSSLDAPPIGFFTRRSGQVVT